MSSSPREDEPLDHQSENEAILQDPRSGRSSAAPSSASEQEGEVAINHRIESVQSNGSRTGSQSPSKKPKTVGGFIAEDSDEDDDDATNTSDTSAALQVPATTLRNRALSPSPLHNVVAPDEVQTPDEPESKDQLPQIPNTVPALPTATLKNTVSSTRIAPTILANQPKARLPHDKMGILEDRIKEDPKGDVDAWLALIGEYRSRNKLEDARAAYDRFLAIFPQSVSSIRRNLGGSELTHPRQKCG